MKNEWHWGNVLCNYSTKSEKCQTKGVIIVTSKEQLHLNMCYANLKAALDELALIRDKDRVLARIQNQFYVIEDTLHQYVGPVKKGVQ